MSPCANIDHLVVMADTLQAGAAWCQRTLGTPSHPGGQHARFGTHNRLLNIAQPVHPHAYLELIAIDPQAPAPTTARWFDMDDARLRERVRTQGPQLIHWVAAVPDLDAALARLRALGLDGGHALSADRMTPQGLLQWRIAVRSDGQRLFEGCLPTLIQWGPRHPIDHMPPSPVALHGLHLTHPDAPALRAALQAVGLPDIPVATGPARISAHLHTPAPVALHS